VELKWETITEVNNYGFEIQRSEDKTDWDIIGFVNGNGNSNIPHYYQLTDKDNLPDGKPALPAGRYYYRLKQIDTDGSFEYSPVLEIEINNIIEEYTLSQNYPNPFNPSTKIEFKLPVESKITLTIFNVIGEKVTDLINGKLFSSGVHEILFDASHLASGIYFYSFQTSRFSKTKKMILLP
ncbi:MAG TPA: T9SS type A sorting domain-containing protein, partial [Ignavibacteriaceae bacterium]